MTYFYVINKPFIRKILLITAVVLQIFINTPASVFSMDPEQKRIIDSGSLYFNNIEGGVCSTSPFGGVPSSGTGDSAEAGSTFVAWNSGLSPPYIMEQYIIEVLKYIADFKGVPRENVVTQEHVLALLAFAWGEGGDINNSSTFNLFNTSALRNDPEAMPYAAGGRDGRLAYANFDVGIKATGGTMLLPRYSRLIDALIDPNSTASQVLYNYTHYSQFPGNGWWAEQNEIDGEGVYYNKMLGFLRGMQSNYQTRASTIIGTPEREQQTGARDPSKLVYDGTGAAATPGGTSSGAIGGGVSSSAGGQNCIGGSGGGEGGIAEVDGFTFPLKTNKSTVKKGLNGAVWCWNKQANCHHNYNAADIFVPVGTIVVAAKEGVVVLARESSSSCGSSVAILGSDDHVYYYTHMGSVSVSKGASVSSGTQLGNIGDKACGTTPHLHFDLQPPPAKNRAACRAAACNSYTFLEVQPVLTKSFEGLPE